MTNQKQTPHFPCGPCPIQDEIYARIIEYRFQLKDMQEFELSNRDSVQGRFAVRRIALLQDILSKLWDLYHLAQVTLTQFNIQEKP